MGCNIPTASTAHPSPSRGGNPSPSGEDSRALPSTPGVAARHPTLSRFQARRNIATAALTSGEGTGSGDTDHVRLLLGRADDPLGPGGLHGGGGGHGGLRIEETTRIGVKEGIQGPWGRWETSGKGRSRTSREVASGASSASISALSTKNGEVETGFNAREAREVETLERRVDSDVPMMKRIDYLHSGDGRHFGYATS